MQSVLPCKTHLGIIMDGNGRWAEARGMPRSVGHRAGVRAIRSVVEAAGTEGVGTLTLYAFSSDNWRRPPAEVAVLLHLLQRYLETEVAALASSGVRLTMIGRRDRLPAGLCDRIAAAEARTAAATGLHLRIAFDYSSRDAILTAARSASPATTQEEFSRLLTGGDTAPAVDLLVRTGGEKRLSDFLLWECAYAELMFVERMWPDFGPDDIANALTEFRTRQRRFGGLPAEAAAA